MRNNLISQFVLTLFDESRDGWLTLGMDMDRFDYEVDWDRQTADILAQECADLVDQLTELAGQYDKLLKSTRQLTKQQSEIWNIFLRPFPDDSVDREVLRPIWEKEAIGLPLNPQERKLALEYNEWYEEQALKRLPWKGCAPTGLINCAMRYGRLIRLDAPMAVCENEARRFAEEFVLYHCMKQ